MTYCPLCGTGVTAHRRVDDETLRSEADGSHLAADGSRWEISTGDAVDGPHQGTELASAARQSQLFWFTWLDSHPDTTVFGVDSRAMRRERGSGPPGTALYAVAGSWSPTRSTMASVS